MSTEAFAIVGLFLGLWSHEVLHRHEEKGGNRRLALAVGLGIASIGFLIFALVRAVLS